MTRIKKIAKLFLIICIYLSSCNVFSYEVLADSTVKFGNTSVVLDYGPGDYFTDDHEACKVHYTDVKCKNTYNGIYLGASQCFGYARYIQQKIFGKNSYTNSGDFYHVSGVSVAAGNLTADIIKNVMMNSEVKPGAHIRTKGSTQHSMVVTQITSSGFSIIQCNGSNNNEYTSWTPCRIGTYTYTWSSYASSTYGKRGIDYIEMPKNYTLDDGGGSADLTQDGSYPTPITCVPAIASGKINVYNRNGNVESNRWIDADDQCTIRAIYTNGLCAIDYPSGSGTRSAYAKKSDFITNAVTPYTWSPSVQLESYKRSDLQGGSFGKVFTTDKCTVVGKNGDIWQLIYPIAGGYKLGWVNTANTSSSQPSVPNPSVIPSPKFVDFVGNKQIVVMIPDKITFSSSAYISAGDICIINTNNVGQGQCAVRYPSGGNNVFNNYKTIKDATINIDQAISYNPDFEYQKATAQEKYTVYPTAAMTQSVSGNSTNWSLDPGDEYYTINRSGDATEVLYYCNTGAHKGYWKIGWAYIPYYTLDLNGYLDQNNTANIDGYGCVDVYVNGNQLGGNVTDFCQQFPCGSTYEFKNIQAYNGFTYTGVQNGSLSGTITGNLDIRLAFVKNAAVCTGINIESRPSKVTYLEGDSWDQGGLSVIASYSDGTTKNVTNACQVTGYDSTPGVKTIKISYSGFETAFSVNVSRKELEKLEIVSPPNKITYNIGEELDYSGLQLKAYYNNGTTEIVTDYESYADEYITQREGTKTIELSYSYYEITKYVTFEITVVDQYKNAPTLKMDSVSVKKGQKFNVDLKLNNNPGIASLKIKVNYDSTLLKLVQVKYNSELGGNSQLPQTLKSPFILNWFNGTENFNGNDTFATITFEVISDQNEAVETTLDITYDNEDIFNIKEENLGLKLDIGTITISDQVSGKVLLEMDDDFSYVQGTVSGFGDECSYGVIYKRGRVSNLTLDTPGRIQVAFMKLTKENTFTYDMSGLMGYTYRAYVIYKNENGEEQVDYSEPVFG